MKRHEIIDHPYFVQDNNHKYKIIIYELMKG